jgi:hypothetical protein
VKSPIGLFLAEFRADEPVSILESSSPDLAVFAAGLDDLTIGPPDEDEPLALPAPIFETGREPVDVTDEFARAPEPVTPPLSDEIASFEVDHADTLAQARQQWALEEGTALAQRFEAALAAFETRIADALAPMLEPFLVKGAQLRVIAELRDALKALIEGDERPAITVTGPADLLAALEAAFRGEPALAFEVADTPDVTITAGETLVRSQLRDWASALEESLGEAA